MMDVVKKMLFFVMVCAFLVFCMTIQGCKEIQYVPVHTTDTLVVNNYIRDSIHSSDSVYVYRNTDTFYVYKEKVLWREKTVHDTVLSMKEKEVPVEVEKVVEVEKHTPVKNAFAWIGFLSSIVLLGYILYRFKK